MKYEIKHGDCLEVLRGVADSSIDAIVTDPPYGLSFMGKKWDYDVPSVDIWRECLRVLKPGGHLLAFAGTRTQHRMAVNIEDAGFEIRDMIAWVYGSGFPKSLDVSKAIDKANGRKFEDRYALGRHIKLRRIECGLTHANVNEWFGYRDGCQHWERQDASGARVPTLADYAVLKARLDLSDEFDELVARIEAEREVVGKRDGAEFVFAPGEARTADKVTLDITAPATEAARQWQGWGTALKPAMEPISVARKPIAGTVAENVLEHGTGALNVDGCRVGEDGGTTRSRQAEYPKNAGGTDDRGQSWARTGHGIEPINSGRWPANLIHDGSDEVVGLFPETGISAGGRSGHTSAYSGGFKQEHYGDAKPGFGDSGSAARFFYCAKASKADRDEGCEGMEEQQRDDGRKDGNPGGDNPRNRGLQPRANHHPTVKPTALMRYLCRLVTPPKGIILDPFTGSGSTGKAAMLEGFNFIGIEREAEYVEIAKARIEKAQEEMAGMLI